MKHKAMSIRVRCRGERGRPAAVAASLRNDYIALHVEGGRPHMSLEEAYRLLNWLHDAIDEGYERRQRNNWGPPG